MSRRMLLLVAAVVLASCASSDGDLTVADAWGRPSPSMAAAAAFYMEISNPNATPDTLQSASSSVCGAVELHESVLDDAQVMSMSELESGILIEGDSSVMLEPGGMHIMCIGLDHELIAGEVIDVQLQFETASDRDIEVTIRDS